MWSTRRFTPLDGTFSYLIKIKQIITKIVFDFSCAGQAARKKSIPNDFSVRLSVPMREIKRFIHNGEVIVFREKSAFHFIFVWKSIIKKKSYKNEKPRV